MDALTATFISVFISIAFLIVSPVFFILRLIHFVNNAKSLYSVQKNWAKKWFCYHRYLQLLFILLIFCGFILLALVGLCTQHFWLQNSLENLWENIITLLGQPDCQNGEISRLFHWQLHVNLSFLKIILHHKYQHVFRFSTLWSFVVQPWLIEFFLN